MQKDILLIALFPPGSKLENEGLGRYLEALIASSKTFAVGRENAKIFLHVAPWHETWARRVVSGTPVSIMIQNQFTLTSLILSAWSLRRISIATPQLLQVKSRPEEKNNATLCNWSGRKTMKQVVDPNSKILRGKVAISLLSTFWIKIRARCNSEALKMKYFASKVLNKNDYSHKIFDKLFRRYCISYLKKLGTKNILVLLHNRIPVPNSKNVILFVPDLIPLEFSELFSSESKRWDNLAREIRDNCERAEKWITFSDYTASYAQQKQITSAEHQIKVIRHASKPPGLKLHESLTQDGKENMEPPLECWWESGQSRIFPTNFRDHAFVDSLEYVFYPSQYRPHKEIEGLILLWPKITAEFPNLKLVLTVDPVHNPKIQKMVDEANLELVILFLPSLSERELIAWMARSTIMLSFSRAEGAMPFMVSEAMEVKVPFLIRDLEVSREILPKDVQGVSFFNDDSAADVIITSLNKLEQLLNFQLNWYQEYSRTWTEVWEELMQTLEDFSD